MTRFLLMLLVLPTLSLAQDSERFLTSTQLMLAQNTRVDGSYDWGSRKEERRLNTAIFMTDNLFQRAERYRYTREFNQAVPLYEKVVLLEPKRQGYVAYIYLAFLHDYARALHHFNAYDAQTPNFDDIEGNSPVSFYRGIIFLKTGEFSAAIDQFDKAIGYIEMKHGADWVNYRYYINRAMGFLAINQPEKALTDLDKALKNYRQSPLAYFYRGRALQQLGRAAEAKAAFMDAQFFFRANRADAIRVNQSLMPEDQYFPLHEPEIEEALAILNK